jgi:hypothetical protein
LNQATRTLEAAFGRTREAFSRFDNGKERAGIGPGDRAQRESQVGHRTPQASSAQRQPRERRLRIRCGRSRPEAHHIAERGRIAEEPPVSEPLATGANPQANATAAPPEDPHAVEVVGIARRAQGLVERLRSRAEFGVLACRW